MPNNKLDITVDQFHGLDAAAKTRVQAALHTALENELTKVGGAAEGFFGDGSVKGMPTADRIRQLQGGNR